MIEISGLNNAGLGKARENSSSNREIRSDMFAYILPRLYKKIFVGLYFSIIYLQSIPQKVYNFINYGEHHLIFKTAISISSSFYYYRDKPL